MMSHKFVLRTASGARLNTVEYGGETDMVKARMIAENEIIRKRILWIINAPHIIDDEQLIITEK